MVLLPTSTRTRPHMRHASTCFFSHCVATRLLTGNGSSLYQKSICVPCCERLDSLRESSNSFKRQNNWDTIPSVPQKTSAGYSVVSCCIRGSYPWNSSPKSIVRNLPRPSASLGSVLTSLISFLLLNTIMLK